LANGEVFLPIVFRAVAPEVGLDGAANHFDLAAIAAGQFGFEAVDREFALGKDARNELVVITFADFEGEPGKRAAVAPAGGGGEQDFAFASRDAAGAAPSGVDGTQRHERLVAHILSWNSGASSAPTAAGGR